MTPSARRSDWVLLDTDVFSYLLGNRGELAGRYRPHVNNRTVAVSFVTVGEVYSGLFKHGLDAHRVHLFETRLASVVVLPYTIEMCRTYGGLILERTPQGSARTLGANDRWIAAAAIHYGLRLVTNNARNFRGLSGLDVITEA
jgi:predicted nucleic acid-binding protein